MAEDSDSSGGATPGSIGDKDAVGYCKPPKANQFQKGRSGNPKGRPRRKTTLTDEVNRALAMPVTTIENGKA